MVTALTNGLKCNRNFGRRESLSPIPLHSAYGAAAIELAALSDQADRRTPYYI
jgi:hypothetical protein